MGKMQESMGIYSQVFSFLITFAKTKKVQIRIQINDELLVFLFWMVLSTCIVYIYI